MKKKHIFYIVLGGIVLLLLFLLMKGTGGLQKIIQQAGNFMPNIPGIVFPDFGKGSTLNLPGIPAYGSVGGFSNCSLCMGSSVDVTIVPSAPAPPPQQVFNINTVKQTIPSSTYRPAIQYIQSPLQGPAW